MSLIRTVQTICVLILGIAPLVGNAQSIAFIGDYALPTKEFLWVYKKNNPKNSDLSYLKLSDYLNLYLDFKLKVLEAKRMALDADTAYLKEVGEFEKKMRSKYGNRKPDLNFMINEYKEGVLMFNISETKIWNPSNSNSPLSVEQVADLEQKWIEGLRSKYEIRVVEAELKRLAKD